MNSLHRLWDHLGSNLSSYVQPQELHPVGVPKTEPAAGDQPAKTGSHQIKSEADKGTSVETYRHHQKREHKGLVKVDDDEVSHRRKSVENNLNSRNVNQPSDSQTKPHRSPQSTIHKKRRQRDEAQHPRKVIFSRVVLFKYNFSKNIQQVYLLHYSSFFLSIQNIAKGFRL